MKLLNLWKKLFSPSSLQESIQRDETTGSVIEENKKKAAKIGEIGEYKINIQLAKLSREYPYLSDLMLKNPKSRSGYSQIDHVVLTPYGIFIIETKNYQGIIKGTRKQRKWYVNGKFEILNPLIQNYGHIESVKMAINIPKEKRIFSIVSFTRRCTFKVELELRDIKSDQLIIYDTELSEYIYRKVNIEKTIHGAPIYTDKDIQSMFRQLKEANQTDPDLRQRHIEIAQSSKKENISRTATCFICNKPVSEKVKAYCLGNRERFHGKVYCFEHQKEIQ